MSNDDSLSIHARDRVQMVAGDSLSPFDTGRLCAGFAYVVIASCLPDVAWGHVKWFAPYDLTAAPVAPHSFSGDRHWLTGLALSVPALWLAVGLDQLAKRRPNCLSTARPLWKFPVHPDDLVRIAMGVWLTWLWSLPSPVFLTPELAAPTEQVSWVQLFVAVFCLSRRSAWITGVAVLLLYASAASHYGLFHVADYPLFLGLAAYLIGISTENARGRILSLFARHRQTLLVLSMTVTLCWAAMEKWAYPAWSTPILHSRPHLSMGLEPSTFMIYAGWAEFGLVMVLAMGGRLSSRLAASVLLAMFSGAVVEFGKVDLVGHMPIIASLTLVLLVGNGQVGAALGLSRSGPWSRAVGLPAVYFTALAIVSVAYFGGWQLAYGGNCCGVSQSIFHDPKLFFLLALTTLVALIGVVVVRRMAHCRRSKTTPSSAEFRANV